MARYEPNLGMGGFMEIECIVYGTGYVVFVVMCIWTRAEVDVVAVSP